VFSERWLAEIGEQERHDGRDGLADRGHLLYGSIPHTIASRPRPHGLPPGDVSGFRSSFARIVRALTNAEDSCRIGPCVRFVGVKAVATSWLALTVLAGLLAATAQFPSSRKSINISTLGPQVGERVPDFSLKDPNGKSWMLQSIMGPKGAMLVFVRSADW
jgi:hypothetical protein